MFKITLMLLLIFPCSSFAEMAVFAKTIGGLESDFAYSIQPTIDGGYIVAGSTESFGNGSSSMPDMWIIKLDSNGNKAWEKTFGESGKGDVAFAIQQTTDGGYIVAGTTSSFGEGYPSMWIIKLDAIGNTTWTKVYEGRIASTAYAIQQTLDGGFIVVGKGEENILKLDVFGKKEWGKRFGWIFYAIKQTTDGGYIAVGDSIYRQLDWNYIPCVTMYKLDANGNAEWSNPLGSDFIGSANSVQPTTDGGYVIAGDSIAMKSEYESPHHLMVLKLEPNGTRAWSYFGNEFSSAQSIQQTKDDGGYIVAGNTIDAGHGLDFLLLKLDVYGTRQWLKTYGSSNGWEYAAAIQQTADGGYIVAGQTDFNSAGRYDMWILKLDVNGNGSGTEGIPIPNEKHFQGFTIAQNYPNPFNQSVTIHFSLTQPSLVTLKVFNLNGEAIETIINKHYPAGTFNVAWSTNDLSSGIYFCRWQAGQYAATKKLVIQQ